MKALLIVVALLVAVEAQAHQGWPYYGHSAGNGRGFNYPGRGPWAYPQQQQNQNNIYGSDVEWVCQNPKTNDMMIIATDNTRRQHPGGGPWWQSQNPGHQGNRHQHGNQWEQPIIVVEQEPTNSNTNNNRLPPLFPQTSETPNNNNNNNNNNNQPQSTTPPYHGGEGMIDIRVAQ
ncbi:probable basic-leucine zipper transcription factor J [Nylanderia fulva]|uniref:probable basic-leucine zipper transcription factor J n=1 Tax=Nylanderia fulva TaxID=613905 RepID=UPI0010FB8F48|nr:probable basic-leucine zipper transcription factor J [Nylanderia fulva]